MTTAYTAKIAEGISFNDFVLLCARAFGAIITMRDDSLDIQIPDEFKPDDHHIKRYDEYIKEQEQLAKLTQEECAERANCEYLESIKSLEDQHKSNAKKLILKAKYENMLDKVKAWIPPSTDHISLRDFMIEQIEGSIEFDCNIYNNNEEIIKLTGEQWLSNQYEYIEKQIAYHKKEYLAECKRVGERNRWIKLLKENLKGE